MADTPMDLLEHPVYGFHQVDRVLGLSPGTAKRWIDGYERGKRFYPPVVRVDHTRVEIVTWGEFVETRFLAEYRDKGVPMHRMRPAIDRLRQTFHPKYPLAYARPFVAGRELVLEMQESVGLERRLQLVVVRNDQIVLTEPAENFYRSVEYGGPENDQVAERVKPHPDISDVVVEPLRQFGEPVIRGRGVRTEVIAEQFRAGESLEAIAEIYELPIRMVEAAVRYELYRNLTESAA
jgi:uncharacterized protein (DUF433 family)